MNNSNINTRSLMASTKFYESYSRYNPFLERHETWNESVDRVMTMHRDFYKDRMNDELSKLIDKVETAYKNQYVLGSQRSLQFGGEQILKNHFKLYNCCGGIIDRPEAFGEAFYILLTGCGVGFSIQKQHIEKLPKIVSRTKSPKTYVVEDSIEGWASALDVLMSSYFENGGKHPEYKNRRVYFDLSSIRPKGAMISGGFKAPGPEPLRLALDKIEYLLQGLVIKNKEASLRPIHVFDILMHTADSVLAGGVRRCLPEWYEVKTTVGWKKIKDVIPEVDSIVVPEGIFKIVDKFEQGVQQLYKIETEQGCHFSTGNHRWLVQNNDTKQIEWVKAIDLSKGKYSLLKPKLSTIRQKEISVNIDLNLYNLINVNAVSLDIEENTYDIEVNQIHMFEAKNPKDGLSSISHNSAVICLFSLDDEEMMKAKTGNWFIENPQRARANISASILRNEVQLNDFRQIMENVKEFGEPGFYFADDHDFVTNPCITSDSLINTSEGLKYVKDLIDIPFNAVVNGEEYKSKGFFKTGTKNVYEVKTKNGFSLKATEDHKFLVNNDGNEEWIELKDLQNTDKLVINRNDSYIPDFNSQEFQYGYLVGIEISLNKKEFVENNKQELFYICKDINRDYLFNLDNEEFNNIDNIITLLTKKYVNTYMNYMKILNKSILEENDDFLCGIVQGIINSSEIYFYGTVFNEDNLKIVLNNEHTTKLIQLILNKQGIVSLRESSSLSISKDNLHRLSMIVKFSDENRQSEFLEILNGFALERENYTSGLQSITYYGEEDVYDCTVEDVHRFEANGLIVHNCVEIGFKPITNSGDTGWQLCNLCEINGAKCNNEEDFLYACEMAAILGTLQAGYTNFKFVGKETKEIVEREALLGCSITGFMNNPKILFDENILKKGANLIKKTNKKIAKLININPAARTTCVKPAGSTSVLLQTVSGIHPEHSPLYIRNVQINKENQLAKIFLETNPHMIEESAWSVNKTDYIISFPIISPENSLFKDDIIGIKHLELVKKVFKYWVEEGTDKHLCTDIRLRHNVSNTIIVDDWEALTNYIFENKDSFSGISFLPMSGDRDYYQAPFTSIHTEHEIIKKYGRGAMFASGLIVEANKAFNNLWIACMTAKGIGENISMDSHENSLKRDWVRRFNNYSNNYFDGDNVKTEHCLKDIFLLHKWEKIQKSYTPFDWNSKLTKPEYVDINTLAAIACAGGACEI